MTPEELIYRYLNEEPAPQEVIEARIVSDAPACFAPDHGAIRESLDILVMAGRVVREDTRFVARWRRAS